VVMRQSAYFLLAFVNIGLIPDGGSSVLVPERIGFTRAMEMAMLGERIDATRSVEWGLANRSVPDDAFDAEIDALAEKLATGPTRAHAAIKRQLNAWLFDRMAGQLDLEAELQQQSATSGDFREGVLAFLQKRPAAFTGA
jgi:2-(1,2-epoxy-1,2-dihydrophenyl)acetyl-CoA isomerase